MATSRTLLRVKRQDVEDGRIPFSLRLKAWWEGYEVQPPRQRKRPQHQTKTGHDVRAPEADVPWDDARISLVQEVWGRGLDRPGDRDHITGLCAPMGMDSSMSVLDLGAGLGGGTRAICRAYDCWMTGVEPDPQLAEVAHKLSERAGLTRKAAIHQSSLDDPELKPRGYNRIFAKESFFRVTDKVTLLDRLEEALKPGGQLLFTDYVVLDSTVQESEAIQAWRECERTPVTLYSVDDYQDALKDRKLKIPVAEDVTEQVAATIQHAWASYMHEAQDSGRIRELGGLVLKEAELWTRRLRALQNGDLRVYRFHALKKDENKMLADW